MSVDSCALVFAVNAIIRGLLGRAVEGNAIHRAADNGLSANTMQHLRRLEDASKPILEPEISGCQVTVFSSL